MDYFLIYSLFSITTAFTAVYELLMPIIRLEEKSEGKVEYKFIMYVTFFFFSLLIAPFVFFSCIIPSLSTRFQNALHKGLFPAGYQN